MKIKVLAQYSENYAAQNEDWNGVTTYWKPKGGAEFIIYNEELAYIPHEEIERIVKEILESKSNLFVNYYFLDLERIYEDPEDISKDFAIALNKMSNGGKVRKRLRYGEGCRKK